MVKVTDALQELCNQVFRWIPQPKPTDEALKNCLIVAHRGCWNDKERLENTMAAFMESLKHDIWAIEFDIRWTLDHVPVVHHDASTERVFKKSLVIAETAFKDLRASIPQIPTLQEVVNVFGKNRHLMIELKTLCQPNQVKQLEKILEPLKPVEDYHFMSLEWERFSPLTFAPQQCFVTIARTNIKPLFNRTIEVGYGALTGQYLLLTDSMKEACHQKAIKVGTGFPDSKNLFYREAHRGVDWVFTNHAALLASFKS